MKQLRMTTCAPHSMFEESGKPLIVPEDLGEIVAGGVIGNRAYFHGELETLAGFDLPIFLDGDIKQLDMPHDRQNILVLLPSGEYPCIATLDELEIDAPGAYYITLKNTDAPV